MTEPSESTMSLVEVKPNLPTDAPFYEVVLLNQASSGIMNHLGFQF